MIKSIVTALAATGALLMSMAAAATPVTYGFAGRMADGGDFAGQAITGTFTFDPALYTIVSTDGSTFGWSYLGDAPDGATRVDLRIGDSVHQTVASTAATAFGFHVDVFKHYVEDEVPDGFDAYELSAVSSDAAGNQFFVTLSTSHAAIAPDPMFPGAASDLSPSQPVAFLTAGSDNVGFLGWFNADGTSSTDEFTITRISAVPEAPTGALLAGGLALLALRRRAGRDAA